MENKYSIKGMILDICSMKPHISKLLISNKPYVPILEYLMKFDYYDEDNFSPPTAKMIETETGIKYGKIRNLLEMLYNEITRLYYYKCRTNGCIGTKNANQLHEDFEKVLKQYELKPVLIEVIKDVMSYVFSEVSDQT